MKLLEPIVVDKTKTVTEINFPERAIAKHFIGVSISDVMKQKTEALLSVISRATGEPMHVLEKLGFQDLFNLIEELFVFLGYSKPTKTGEDTPSEAPSETS